MVRTTEVDRERRGVSVTPYGVTYSPRRSTSKLRTRLSLSSPLFICTGLFVFSLYSLLRVEDRAPSLVPTRCTNFSSPFWDD